MRYNLHAMSPVEVQAEIPDTLEHTTNKGWLEQVLAPIANNAPLESVELTDVIKAMAAKVRLVVNFGGDNPQQYHLCIKGFLDHDLEPGAGGLTTLREADFYLKIAPQLSMETPPCPIIITDRDNQQCIFIMEDMINAGAHFYNALEPLTVDQVAETLDQLARLHAAENLVQQHPWLPNRLSNLAQSRHLTTEKIQQLMLDERRGGLSDTTLDAQQLIKGIQKLAEWNAAQPHTLLHGDCHPGNVYRTASGQLGFTDWQLIQRGHWSLDVAYHIASVLPVEVAEASERQLLEHYLEVLHGHGGRAPAPDAAWEDYRRAQVYGYFQWAITQRVHPPITHQAFQRLGAAVTRHQSYQLLGL